MPPTTSVAITATSAGRRLARVIPAGSSLRPEQNGQDDDEWQRGAVFAEARDDAGEPLDHAHRNAADERDPEIAKEADQGRGERRHYEKAQGEEIRRALRRDEDQRQRGCRTA